MAYSPRLTKPSTTNKYCYDKIYNAFAGGSYAPPKVSGNCVWYAYGRFAELLDKKPNLHTGNAENWYGKKDGYSRGQMPKLGAVICWSKGKVGVESDGAGHVAIVEKIDSNGTITTSNSAYKGSYFFLETIKKPYNRGTYTFQGFIYNPSVLDEIKPITPVKEPIIYIVKKGDTLNGIAIKYKTTADKIAKDNNIKNKNIIKIGQKLKIN